MDFAGGRIGNTLRDGLLAEAFAVSFVDVGDEIRQNITLLDETNDQYTKINEQGPTIGLEHLAALEELIERTLQPGDLWALCGRMPLGAPPRPVCQTHQSGAGKESSAFLDTSHAPLREGMRTGPFAFKINIEEAGELLGRHLEGEQAVLEAARELQAKGTRLVALTRGAQGLVLAMDAGMVIAAPPPVTALSPVGAGNGQEVVQV